MNPKDRQFLDSLCWLSEAQRIVGLLLVSTTHLGLRAAPGGRAGVKDVDLVVPTPESEQGVSYSGLAEKDPDELHLPKRPPPILA